MMKNKFNSKTFIMLAVFLVFFFTGWFVIFNNADTETKSCFYSSLHHAGEGMRYWYEENGGFMDVTGIPYSNLDCKNCHIKSCEQCHAVKEGDKCSYSLKKAKDTQTCLTCHSRAKVTFKLCREKKTLDVHIANGMGCVDCHKGDDVHGDGTFYKTMRDEGAVKVACKNCHEDKGDIRSHTVHKGKLDCAACHIANTTSCLNCHFDKFIEEGTRKGNFFPPCQDWVILVNYKGKVTSGNVQTLLYKDKKFVTYAPYFTHAVQSKARECKDCHANKAVKRLRRGKSIQMAKFKENHMISWNGVVPLVVDKLKWDFAYKKGDKWIGFKSKEKTVVQLSCYAEPLTPEQLKKLAIPYKK